MRGIIVIDEAGITRASVGFEEIEGNTDLFGTVLSALQSYWKQEFHLHNSL